MKFYNPLGFLILAVIPIVIILHFFKSKNQKKYVSSLYLWNRAKENSKESRTSRKLNEILRLIIQLMAVLMAGFACARPYIPTDAGKYTIIADCSMSMEKRADEMKKEISDFVNGLDKNSEIVLIGGNDNPKILIRSDDKKKITDTVGELETGITKIDYSKIKTIAENTNGECWFFSDLNDDDIPVEWNTVKIGENSGNTAVTYLNADDSSVLARVSNFSEKDIKTKLSLYIDDKMYECKEISISAESSENIVFNGITKGNTIKCVVNDDEGIYSDNTMYTQRVYKKVLLCCDNIFIEKAVSAVGNISIDKAEEPIDGYDVYIFDGKAPQILPKGNIIIFNAPKDNGIVNIAENTEVSNIKSNDKDFFQGEIEFCIEKASKIDDTGYSTILSADETPLIIRKGNCILTSFDLHDSDFVLYKEFPIFINNCFDFFRGNTDEENPDISESNLRTSNIGTENAGTVGKTKINRSIQSLFAILFVLLIIADTFVSVSKRGEK